MVNNTAIIKDLPVFQIGLTIILLLFILTPPVNAQSANTQYNETVKPCFELEAKVSQLIDSYSQKQQDHLQKYDQISSIYQSIYDELQLASYDVAILYELKPGLLRRVAHFKDMSDSFLGELTDVHDAACNDVESYNQELEEARQSIKDVQSSVTDIKVYIREILLPAIRVVVNGGENF